jgi:hypothetical protein
LCERKLIVADGHQGEEAKWRFRVTHTDGEKLAQPMILYPSWINEEFMIFERYLTLNLHHHHHRHCHCHHRILTTDQPKGNLRR